MSFINKHQGTTKEDTTQISFSRSSMDSRNSSLRNAGLSMVSTPKAGQVRRVPEVDASDSLKQSQISSRQYCEYTKQMENACTCCPHDTFSEISSKMTSKHGTSTKKGINYGKCGLPMICSRPDLLFNHELQTNNLNHE